MKIIIFSLLLSVSFLSCVGFGCEGYIEQLHDMEFDGIVSKLEVTKQRSYQYVYIDNDDKPLITVFHSMDQGVWQGLEVGYRIKKSSGNSYVLVTDNLGKTKRYPLICK
jgi:hypothetical protein